MNSNPPPFTESMRYDYPLDPTDLVIDAGYYKGTFSNEIANRYGCQIIALEPCPDFYTAAFPTHSNITLFNVGLWDANETALMYKSNDATGLYADSNGKPFSARLITPLRLLQLLGNRPIAFLKLNIEGSEYRVLRFILRRPKLIERIHRIQVQFHRTHTLAESLRAELISDLSTHYTTDYSYPFIWESFTHKSLCLSSTSPT